jgi:hypothetical protein
VSITDYVRFDKVYGKIYAGRRSPPVPLVLRVKDLHRGEKGLGEKERGGKKKTARD